MISEYRTSHCKIFHKKVDYQYNTGSFNFTKNAQEKNAENLLIIESKGLATLYLENWNQRKMQSLDLESYEIKKLKLHKK